MSRSRCAPLNCINSYISSATAGNQLAAHEHVLHIICRDNGGRLAQVSEGLDFADSNARAVLIFGIPFPNVKDTKVGLKKAYNDAGQRTHRLLSGDQWYSQQAFRSVSIWLLSVYEHFCLSLSVCLSLSGCLPAFLSVCLSLCLSVDLSLCHPVFTT